MSIASPVFPLVVVAACLAAAELIARSRGGYGAVFAHAPRHRFAAIDGLRGFLALGVFFTHVMTTRGWYVHGAWDASFAPFYVVCGQAGVSLFFMITGFLYWRRVLAPRPLDAAALFRSRIARLAPMYFASVALALTVIAARSGFRLESTPLQLVREVRPWLSFGFMSTGPVNGVADAHMVNAVYWTLAVEWMFYLALPVAALFARGPGFALLLGAVLFFGVKMPIALDFVAGALAAVAMERGWLEGRLAAAWLAPVPLGALAAALALPTAYAPAPIALLFVFFLFVADGNTLLGLLATRAARLLGTVSYSFYLLHGIVLYVAFRAVQAALPVRDLTPAQHWGLATVAALGAVALSTLTYRYVERPFIEPRPAAPEVPVEGLPRAVPG